MKYTTFQKAVRAAQRIAVKEKREFFVIEWNDAAFYVLDWEEYKDCPVDAIASVNELGEVNRD